MLEDVALTALQGMLTAVPDPRSCQGRRSPLSFLLTCLVAALLGNCNGLDAVGQWCREHREVLEQVFGPQRHLTPTGALYRWLLPQRWRRGGGGGGGHMGAGDPARAGR